VPKTAINENSDLAFVENKVWTAGKSIVMHFPRFDSAPDQSYTESEFGGAVTSRSNATHSLASLLFVHDIHVKGALGGLKKRKNWMLASRYHVVELYAGTARSAEAFRSWTRCQLSLLIDNNSYAAATYLANHRKAPYIVRCLSRMGPQEILAQAGSRVDIILGCPPCQGFSENGQRLASDPRNNHLSRFGTIVESLKPLAVGMENVPLAADSKQFRRFVSKLELVGYNWTAGIINAALRGSCQCRLRLVFVAIRKDVGVTPIFPEPVYGSTGKYFSYRFKSLKSIKFDRNSMLGIPASTHKLRRILPYWEEKLGPKKIPCVGDVLDGLPALGRSDANDLAHVRWAHTFAQLRRMGAVPEGGRWRGGEDHYSQSYGRLHRRGLARTITTAFPNAGSGRYWHPTENRSLTLREAARIQGFRDSFRFVPPFSLAAHLVGNALDQAIADLTFQIIRDCVS
jgi:DNA (cytosine-5)-methyltransferase 1